MKKTITALALLAALTSHAAHAFSHPVSGAAGLVAQAPIELARFGGGWW